MPPAVLIADDEEPMRVALEFLMRRRGHEVASVPDGAAALAEIRRSRPALVLLDVEMPGLSGYEVCERVRDDPALSGTRILMLSARSAEVDIAKGLALGADAFLGKPFAAADLMAQVAALLDGNGGNA